jgi:hypothetical protein
MPGVTDRLREPGPHESTSEPSLSSPSRVRHHRQMLAIACVVVILAFVLVEVSDGRVAVRGFTRYPLPEACPSRRLFGLNCPGCGLTRSIIHLAEGDWRASWRSHRLGGIMAALIVFQVPYRLLALRRPDRYVIPTRWLIVLGYLLITMLIGNWLINVITSQVTIPVGWMKPTKGLPIHITPARKIRTLAHTNPKRERGSAAFSLAHASG